jgi:hypothetical protein
MERRETLRLKRQQTLALRTPLRVFDQQAIGSRIKSIVKHFVQPLFKVFTRHTSLPGPAIPAAERECQRDHVELDGPKS